MTIVEKDYITYNKKEPVERKVFLRKQKFRGIILYNFNDG